MYYSSDTGSDRCSALKIVVDLADFWRSLVSVSRSWTVRLSCCSSAGQTACWCSRAGRASHSFYPWTYLFLVLTWASACINWPHVHTAFIVLSLTVVPSGGLNTPVLITFMRRWLVLLIFVRQSAMFSSDRQYLSSWAILSTSMLCLIARTSVWRW